MYSYSHVDCKNEPLDLKLDKRIKKEGGFFIELGANDGYFQSNTAYLEKFRKWKGILIEPSISSFNKCKINRPNSICLNYACVSNTFEGTTVTGDFDGNPMASIDGGRLGSKTLVTVECSTLEKIMDKYSPDTSIDLLSLDVEGYELNILEGLFSNTDKYIPKYILVEVYEKDREKIFKYLESKNYKGENFTNYNRIDNPYWDGTHNDYLFELQKELLSKEYSIPVYICHYKKLRDRKKYLNEVLKDFSVKWFEEYDRDNLTETDRKMYKYDPKKYRQYIDSWDPNNKTEPDLLSLGEIANGITHIKMYEHIINNNIPYALILEDDSRIINPDSFKEELKKYIKQLPENFDTCFISNSFGWTVDNYKSGFFGSQNKNKYIEGQNIYPMKCGRTADAYIISLEGAKKFLKHCVPFCLPIDYVHNYIFATDNINNFWAQPALTHPGSEDVYGSSMGRANDISRFKIYKGLNNKFPHFYNQQKLEISRKEKLQNFTNMISTSENFILVKFGDGELTNMYIDNERDHNCDGNNYFTGLGDDLLKSYIYFLRMDNAYICKWDHVYLIEEELDSAYKNWYIVSQKFVEYNIIIHKLPFKKEQIEFFQTIKNSSRHKIYISNKSMITALTPLMNINKGIEVPDRNSYLQKQKIVTDSSNYIKNIDNAIILFSVGMFAKVLIEELSKRFPNNTYIDIGSTFDGLIRNSRDFNGVPGYCDELLRCYGNIVPECVVCKKSADKQCAVCKKVSYCSRECQAAHWPSHKKECNN